MNTRSWWMAPVVVATIGGGAFAAFALPGLAGTVSVPDRIVVRQLTPATPATHSPTIAASPTASPTARVVVPDRPVVREQDDRYGDSGGRGS